MILSHVKFTIKTNQHTQTGSWVKYLAVVFWKVLKLECTDYFLTPWSKQPFPSHASTDTVFYPKIWGQAILDWPLYNCELKMIPSSLNTVSGILVIATQDWLKWVYIGRVRAETKGHISAKQLGELRSLCERKPHKSEITGTNIFYYEMILFWNSLLSLEIWVDVFDFN